MARLGPAVVAALVLAADGAVGAAAIPADSCSGGAVDDIAYAAVDGVEPWLLSLDVSPVAGDCAAPVAVWVHGGGWRVGDKTNDATARAAFYNAQGWVLVAVNYRLAVPGAQPPVAYPDFNEDVAAALAWVHDEIAGHGGDPDRVLLVGHSAGAAIAAALIADPRYLDTVGLAPAWIDCAVLLDTEGYDVAEMAARDGRTGAIYRNAFGNDPSVWADASPSAHVGDGPLPGDVVIVTRGGQRRVAAAQAFARQLRFAGSHVTVADVSPLSHADVNRLIGSGDRTMTPLMADTLARCAA